MPTNKINIDINTASIRKIRRYDTGQGRTVARSMDYWECIRKEGSVGANSDFQNALAQRHAIRSCRIFYASWVPADYLQTAINVANKRFDDELYDKTADLLTALAEYKSSFVMIATRAAQITKALVQLRRLNFKGVRKALTLDSRKHMRPPPVGAEARAKARAKDYSGAWLEYWMGWAPTYSDIKTSLDILTGVTPAPERWIASSAKYDVAWNTGTVGVNNWAQHHAYGAVRTVGLLELASAKKALASQLGLTNPITTAWNLLPWSWMVDWFGNIGDYLSSFTRFDGWRVKSSFTSVLMKGWDRVGYRQVIHRDATFCAFSRRIGYLPKTKVQFKALEKLSITRAVTSVALLIQLGFKS